VREELNGVHGRSPRRSENGREAKILSAHSDKSCYDFYDYGWLKFPGISQREVFLMYTTARYMLKRYSSCTEDSKLDILEEG
jgi:CRISPR/Cas system CMR subunit Cmr4 (Cas7 group RAMP superfamily)